MDIPAPSLTNLAPWIEALDAHDLAALNDLISLFPRPLRVVTEDEAGRTTPLHSAAMEGWLPGILALLPVSDPKALDVYGASPLMVAMGSFASVKARQAAVRALAPVSDVNQADQDGRTPLGKAIEDNDLKLVDILMQHGADPRRKHREASILMAGWSAESNPTLFERFLPLVDATESDVHGYSLLHSLLFVSGLPEDTLVHRWVQLCAHGADPHACNLEGRSAMDHLQKAMPAALQAKVHAAMVERERQVLRTTLDHDAPPAAPTVTRPRL